MDISMGNSLHFSFNSKNKAKQWLAIKVVVITAPNKQ